jgi:DNA-binding LytR/AlgR family response regulator
MPTNDNKRNSKMNAPTHKQREAVERRLRHFEQYKVMLDFLLDNADGLPSVLRGQGSEATQQPATMPTMFTVKAGNAVHHIASNDVLYCKAQEHFTLLHRTGSRPLLSNEPMSVWAERLQGQGFIRIHRSFLVNLHHCSAFKHQGAEGIMVLTDEAATELPVSRRQKSFALQALQSWFQMKASPKR